MIHVVEIDETNRVIYERLSQNYEAEFSPLTGKYPDSSGLYAFTACEDGYKGFLAHDRLGRPIGFAVTHGVQGAHDVAEFYIIPTARKSGLGKLLAFEIFDLLAGHWQVRQIQGADAAHHFWMRVISEYSSNSFSNSVEDDEEWGRVKIQRFKSRKTGQGEE